MTEPGGGPRGPALDPRGAPSVAPRAATRAAPLHALVVDREAAVRRGVARALLARGLDALTAEDEGAALALLAGAQVDVVLAPLELAEVLLPRLARERPGIPAVLVVAPGDVEAAERAASAGAFAIVTKPFTPLEPVVLALTRAAEQRRLEARVATLERRVGERQDLEAIVGTSPRMHELYRLARGFAGASSPVLLVGEAGTGKSLLAHAIHRQGPRAAMTFLAVDCAALPPEHVAEELFGRAARGASPARAGLFERAHDGTLLLEDVAALPPLIQRRLAAALEAGWLVPEGDGDPVPLGARVVATSREEPRDLVARGALAAELAHRLAPLAIRVPPLRQRKDDIPLLVHHFVRRAARRAGREPPRIGAEAMRVLRGRAWPGNVRELEAAVERAVVLARGDVLVPSDFEVAPAPARGAPVAPAFDAALAELAYPEAKERATEAFDAFYVAERMERASGNVSEAARQAGMDRSNFRRLLKKVGLGKKPSAGKASGRGAAGSRRPRGARS